MATTLRTHAETQTLYDGLFHWAPHQSTAEVDFLLQRDRELLPIEVKSTSRCHTGLLKGLRKLEDLPGLVRRVFIYTRNRPFRSADGIDIWPAQRFATTVANEELWP